MGWTAVREAFGSKLVWRQPAPLTHVHAAVFGPTPCLGLVRRPSLLVRPLAPLDSQYTCVALFPFFHRCVHSAHLPTLGPPHVGLIALGRTVPADHAVPAVLAGAFVFNSSLAVPAFHSPPRCTLDAAAGPLLVAASRLPLECALRNLIAGLNKCLRFKVQMQTAM